MDGIVIGAGIIGATIAWRLAQRGVAVTLFDRGGVGREASTAGAGMLAPGGEVVERSLWARLAVESLRLYPGFIEELEQETGVSIDFRVCGAVDLAYSAEEWAQLRQRARDQRELGIRGEELAAPDVPSAQRQGLIGAIHYPDDGVVDPAPLMRALKAACLNRGVSIAENSRVVQVDLQGRLVEVAALSARLTGQFAVLAGGAWSSSVAVSKGGRRCSLPESQPVKGYLVGYDWQPRSLPLTLRHGHTYALQRASGFTVVGSTSERVGFDRQVEQRLIDDIRERAGVFLPRILDAPPARSWIGFRPAAPGADPVVGRYRDSNLWLAYGHYRNGILLAPVTAREVAGQIISSLGRG